MFTDSKAARKAALNSALKASASSIEEHARTCCVSSFALLRDSSSFIFAAWSAQALYTAMRGAGMLSIKSIPASCKARQAGQKISRAARSPQRLVCTPCRFASLAICPATHNRPGMTTW